MTDTIASQTTTAARRPALRVVGDVDSLEVPAAPSVALPESQDGARKPGRPRGARNKITGDARAMLVKHGPAVVKTLCAFANGRPVFRHLKGGARERIDPTPDQMLTAARVIVDRLVPVLKATDLTSGGNPMVTVSLSPFDSGVLGRPPDVSREDWTARTAAPRPADDDDTDDSHASAILPAVTGSHTDPVTREPIPQVGESHNVAGLEVRFTGLTNDAREVWSVTDGDGQQHGIRYSRADAEARAHAVAAKLWPGTENDGDNNDDDL